MKDQSMRIRFEQFVLDRELGRLETPDGEVHLRPQTFRLLETLITGAPRIYSGDELLDLVWGTEHLSANSIRQAISELRQALGDTAQKPRFIDTVHRRGYRFVAAIEEETVSSSTPSSVAQAASEEALRDSETPTQALGGRKFPVALALGLLTVLLSLLTIAISVRNSSRPESPEATISVRNSTPSPDADWTTALAEGRRPSIALLDFKNLSGDPGLGWISEAVSELLRFDLAAPGDLRLVPRDDLRPWRQASPGTPWSLGTDDAPTDSAEVRRPSRDLATEDLAALRDSLGADLVIFGAFFSNDPSTPETKPLSLRLQATLVDLKTQATVGWAREVGSIEDLTEVVQRLRLGLEAPLRRQQGNGEAEARLAPVEVAARLASNTESLRLFAEARERLDAWDPANARPFLERAISIDPDNALLHDTLAETYDRLGFYSRAVSSAENAASRAENLPWELQQNILARRAALVGDWPGAAEGYATLYRRFPDSLDYGLRLAETQGRSGQSEDARATVEGLRELGGGLGTDPRIDTLAAKFAREEHDLTSTLALARGAVDEALRRRTPSLAIPALINLSWAQERIGETEESMASLDRACQLAGTTGNDADIVVAEGNRARTLHSRGRTAESLEAYDVALRVSRRLGDRKREGAILNNLGALYGDLGRFEDFREMLERAIEIKREVGDTAGLVTTLTNYANVVADNGRPADGRKAMEEAVTLSQEIADQPRIAFSLRGLALLYRAEERPVDALAAAAQAHRLSKDLGDDQGLAQAEMVLGTLAYDAGDWLPAHQHFETARRLFDQLELPLKSQFALSFLADIAWQQGELGPAETLFRELLATGQEAKRPRIEAEAMRGLGKVAATRGDFNLARAQFDQAIAILVGAGLKELAEEARAELRALEYAAQTSS